MFKRLADNVTFGRREIGSRSAYRQWSVPGDKIVTLVSQVPIGLVENDSPVGAKAV